MSCPLDFAENYQYHNYMSKRHRQSTHISIFNELCTSLHLWKWSSSPAAEVIAIKAPFSARQVVRHFCIDIIKELREAKVTYVWALKAPGNAVGSPSNQILSSVDIIKDLTVQILRSTRASRTEKDLTLTCSQLQAAKTAEDWFSIFESAITRLRTTVYVIVDLEVLGSPSSTTEGFNWAAAFFRYFESLSVRGLKLPVKALLVGYGPSIVSQLQGCEAPIVTVSIRGYRGSKHGKNSASRQAGFKKRRPGRLAITV